MVTSISEIGFQNVQHRLPSGMIHGEGNKTQRTTIALRALPHKGHGSDPGGGDPPHPVMTQV